MRGSPLVRALVVFAVLLAFAPALWRLTHAGVEPKRVVPAAQAPQEQREIQIALAYTAQPSRVAIHHLGVEVWAKDAPDGDEEFSLKIPWPAEGGDLLFKVAWPDAAPLAALRVTLTDARDVEIERSLWGRGVTEKVLRFP